MLKLLKIVKDNKLSLNSCIPKSNKPKLFLKNWRPITLLNCTCIWMHSKLNKKHIVKIITNDQNGFSYWRSYFSFQPVLHDWCNKGCGMCYPVCGMMHIKEPLLLIRKSSPCSGSGFPLSLSEWSFTICPTPYNRKYKCVECVVK